MTEITQNSPVSKLFMVGKSYTSRLERIEIRTIKNLIHHYPFRYDDLSLVSKISQVQPGENVTIKGEILASQNIYTRFGKKIQKAVISDETGRLEAVWFNQPYLVKILKSGCRVSLAGKIDPKGNLISPEYEIIKTEGSIHTGRLVPVYQETSGLSSRWLRSRIAPLVKKLVPQLPDWLPETLKKPHSLINLNQALQKIHFPENLQDIKVARERLGFDELFLLQLNGLIRKALWKKKKISQKFVLNQDKILEFINCLPFSLTRSQNQAIKEILDDLKKDQPMNRLLEGDVGSGKTVVACLACYVAFLNGYRSLFMAPTEILIHQHYKTIKTLLEPLGVKISLLTGAEKSKDIEKTDLVVGTHALIFKKGGFKDVGLVIIDEQHRFGVKQRAMLTKSLINDKKACPHLLTMTATPIPRTMALTFYGDLDLSCLREMPLGRKIVKTWVVPQKKYHDALKWIEKEVKKHAVQAFVICPLIEASDKESMKDIKNVTQEFKNLKAFFLNLKISLLHGRLKSQEKKKILEAMLKGKIDLLVSTPVVEVGIDIPNTTIMLIEGSERFGLAQLHQLRGRVGRGDKQSYCLLFAKNTSRISYQRLKAMEKESSGLVLAEIDLKMRGPGEIYGIKQHGFLDLKIASISDFALVQKTREAAGIIIKESGLNLKKYPLLKKELQEDTIRLVEPN